MDNRRTVTLAKVMVVAAGLTPLAVLIWKIWAGTLRPDPVERMTHVTGLTGLIMLLLTLTITPLRRITGWNVLIRFRRMIGLFAFTYVLIHFLIYIVFDQSLDIKAIADDVVEHPYVTVGFTGFVLLIPLAVTSTKGWIRRLGGRRWSRLHQLIYVVAALGVLHFLWLVKLDTTEPTWYGAALVVLLAARLRSRRKASPD